MKNKNSVNWISTSERQPGIDDFKNAFEKFGPFLVTLKGNFKDDISKRYTNKACYDREKNYWYYSGSNLEDISDDVVAWTYLPNPYRQNEFYTQAEIAAIKNNVFFNKEDILKNIEYLKENTSLCFRNTDFYYLSEKIKEKNIMNLPEDFSKEEIVGYSLNTMDGEYQLQTHFDFSFKYCNSQHSLYVSFVKSK